MASIEEIVESVKYFQNIVNNNEDVLKAFKNWDRVFQFNTNDNNLNIYFCIENSRLERYDIGIYDSPNVIITMNSEILCDIFWGDETPTIKYMTGEIIVKGNQADFLRLDYICSLLWEDEDEEN